jgi:pilus assembly protein Flp/PilA
MSNFTSAVKTFVSDENGITAIEYGLMAALIASGLLLAIGTLTSAFSNVFSAIANKMKVT